MWLINGLLLIILLFLLLFLESFFLRVFSFSVFIIVVISMKGRIRDLPLYVFLVIFSIILDSVMHAPLGTHVLVVALAMLFYDFVNILISYDSKFHYISIFLFLLLYYMLLPVVSFLLKDHFLPNILKLSWFRFAINSMISVCICILVDHFMKFVRSDSSSNKIKLS